MGTALFIIDVQNDFTEGGALGVGGGDAVASGISSLLADERYAHVFASRDWHDGDNDNGGHFSAAPDYVDSWPTHCVAGTAGADYDPLLDADRVDVHVRKGQGEPAYSIFDGVTDDGMTVSDKVQQLGVDSVDVVGIATDYCVRASALDAVAHGLHVRVLTDLVAGVAQASSAAALEEMAKAGVELVA